MEPTLGEIRMFAGNFAPRSWALCEGQLLPINTNQALFSILGTTYGGDGRTNFALPDLRGRASINPDTGPGLPTYKLGQREGTTINILNITQIPSHNHTGAARVSSTNATQSVATNGSSIATPVTKSGRSSNTTYGFNMATPDITLNQNSVTTANTGGNQAINNMQPFLSIYYIICIQGLFPSRN